jgi:hypothetical protein
VVPDRVLALSRPQLRAGERKYAQPAELGPGQTRSPYYDRRARALAEGRLREFYDELVVDDDALERGLADGSLVIDTRLRDALRTLRAQNGGYRSTCPSLVRRSSTKPRTRSTSQRSAKPTSSALQSRLDDARARLKSLELAPGRARTADSQAQGASCFDAMKLVVTVLARDEADVIDAQVAFHLNAGADFVIATDNNSQDGTTEILETYEREGVLHLIHEPAEGLRQGEWVTRMARLAATRSTRTG